MSTGTANLSLWLSSSELVRSAWLVVAGARETVHNWPSLWHFPHNEQTAGWSTLGLLLAAKGPGSDAQNSTNHPPSPANQPAARPRPDQWRSWRPLRRVRATARGSWSLAESGDIEPLHGPGWRSLLLSSACNLPAMLRP